MKRLKKSLASNLIKGAGSVLNIFPEHRKPTGLVRRFYKPHATATDAMAADWEKILNDFNNAWNHR